MRYICGHCRRGRAPARTAASPVKRAAHGSRGGATPTGAVRKCYAHGYRYKFIMTTDIFIFDIRLMTSGFFDIMPFAKVARGRKKTTGPFGV